MSKSGSIVLALVMAAALLVPSPASGSDTSTRWAALSESSSCGDPYTRTPFASRIGRLVDEEPILGPFGTYFGRTIGEVRSQLVDWTVPFSGGRRIQVHQATLPALQQVSAALDAEAARGRVYWVTSAGGFVPRTIGGLHQVSRHALGLSVDINPAQNPYSADNVLITNMPPWFVDAWRSAGFCWGGDWEHEKDPMHFSWMGPGAGEQALVPIPPATSLAPFGPETAYHRTPFAPVTARYRLGISDPTSNGAPDVVGLRSHPDGAVIDIARSTGGYGVCSIARWFVPDESVAGADHVLFADVDGDSGEDLIALSDGGGIVTATVATRRTEYKSVQTAPTGVRGPAASFAAADFDGDRVADLWEAGWDGRLRVWRGPGWTEIIADHPLPEGPPMLIAAADRDGGDTPELFALYASPSASRVDVLGFAGGWGLQDSVALEVAANAVRAIGAVDYDGDGRADIEVLDSKAGMSVHIGNTPTGVPSSRWFISPDWECGDDDVLLSFEGAFYDDEDSPFQPNIDSIAAAEVTRGCNPPFGDMFCPDEPVTRAEMAAFLVRALGLDANFHRGFADVPATSSFAADIGRLATAGITLGCNAAGTRFCPDDPVTRETMAAFLVRGYGLTVNTHRGFFDVGAESIFAEDIGRLATAGITLGCSAAGDLYCPEDVVTREAMAAFLDRAGVLSSS